LINFTNILPEKPKTNDDGIANLEAEVARKSQRLDDLYDLEDLTGAKDRIRSLDEEINVLKGRLTEARKAAKMAEHSPADRLDQLLEMIARLHFADENDRYLLRARIAQELKRIIDRIILNYDREIFVVLKRTSGYEAQMEFRNGRFDGLRLTHIKSGETVEIPRLLFLETQRHMLSNSTR
jgi:hypothetical protein